MVKVTYQLISNFCVIVLVIMSRNLQMVEDQLNKVFGKPVADRPKPADQEMPEEYAPKNVTPIRPAKPGETFSVDFNIQALQQCAEESQKTTK